MQAKQRVYASSNKENDDITEPANFAILSVQRN